MNEILIPVLVEFLKKTDLIELLDNYSKLV